MTRHPDNVPAPGQTFASNADSHDYDPARSIQSLRQEFVERGWARKATGRIVVELFVHLLVAAAGTIAVFAFDNLALRACGMVLVIAGSMGVGTNTHTSSHYATSDRRWVNELLTFFGYPFFLGLSASYWWHSHVVVHHPSPNVIGVDDDADLAPWFTRTQDELNRMSGWRRFYHEKIQWLLLPVLLVGNGFSMQRSGWRFLLRQLRNPEARKPKHWLDLLSLLLHYACMVVAPAILFGAKPVLIFYAVRLVLMGYAMFAVLAPGHFPAEAVCRNKEERPSDFLLLQTTGTVNFRTGWIGRLLCSGLQYQIEHHLFPHFSHPYYPQISRVVRQFCAEHNLPYRSFQWDVALWKCWWMFRHPPAIYRPARAASQSA
ncbi:MAG: acyl-CoA desaturase [Bryobacteraceae bacterium]|nr:acyl-CoA desaturase [Bryobacteraceae bacterium]